MPNTTNYPASLVKDAAAFNPKMVDKMKTWKGIYGPQDPAQGVLDRLILESGTGKAQTLPERTLFEAKKGDERAVNQVQSAQLMRDQLLGELMDEIDPAELERFRAKQRAAQAVQEAAAAAQGPGLIGGMVETRGQLINALKR